MLFTPAFRKPITQSFTISGGEWQEVRVPLPVEGDLVHLRFFPPKQEEPVEIDWIEVRPTTGAAKKVERWNFGAKRKSAE